MSLVDDYVALLQQISALQVSKEELKGRGLPKEAAAVAKKILDLQARADLAKSKIESAERIVTQRGTIAEQQKRVASELAMQEMAQKAGLTREEWVRRQAERAAEFDRQQRESVVNKQARANIDIGVMRAKADITKEQLQVKGLNDALLEETKQQTAIRRLGELRRVGSDQKLLQMGPDSEPVKSVMKQLIETPELQAIGGPAVAQEILVKSQAAHASAVGNIKRVQTKMLADRGYLDKVPADLDVKISAALKTGDNAYKTVDTLLGELQSADIANRATEAETAAKSARRAVLRESYSPTMADRILEAETTKGIKPGTTEHTDFVRGLQRSGKLKSFGIGAGGLILASLIAKKAFGDKEQPAQLPPEMQMALAAKIQQAQGGEDGAKQTSRTLTDIGKLLSIIKTLQGVGGGEAQMPVSAGGIV